MYSTSKVRVGEVWRPDGLSGEPDREVLSARKNRVRYRLLSNGCERTITAHAWRVWCRSATRVDGGDVR